MRRTALTTLNWDGIDADRLTLLKRIIIEHTTALLRSMIAARGSDRPPRGHARDSLSRQSHRVPMKRKPSS
jgi:hypothetical protein